MTKTRRWWVAGFALIMVFALGYRTPKYFNPGVYVLSENTNMTQLSNAPVSFKEDTIYSVAPKDIKVDLNLSEVKKVVYGSFELGNVQQRVFYAATINKKDDIDGLYVDLNRDGVINDTDKVILYLNQDLKDGTRERTTNEPLRMLVDYRTASSVVVHKYLSFRIMVFYHPKSGMAYTAHMVTSWFSGELRFTEGKTELPVKVAIVDGDNDGIFNDFNKGKDLLIADVNYDGRFDKREVAAFSNLFEIKDKDRNTVQYRNYIFPWPYRLAVLPVSEWKSSAAFEPKSDGDPPLPTGTASNEKTPQK